jgi:hypothetical protein
MQRLPLSTLDPSVLELHRQQQQAADQLEQSAQRRAVGEATAIVTRDQIVGFGEFVVVDPTNGALTLRLPRGEASRVNEGLTVCNLSASTNAITIRAADGETINGAQTLASTTAWGWVELRLVKPNRWAART